MSEEKKYTIYKIFLGDDMYIGSTCNYRVRIANHKQNCEKYQLNSKLYQTIRENGGWGSWKHEILHEEVCTKQKARALEDDYIMKLDANLNIRNPVKDYEQQKFKQIIKYHQDKSYKKNITKKIKIELNNIIYKIVKKSWITINNVIMKLNKILNQFINIRF